MKNKDKIILDLCGGTGSWSKPYKDAGYDVRLITLPYYNVRYFNPPENVYGILCAPPCTDFSIARNDKTAKRPRDLRAGMDIVSSCLFQIWFQIYKNHRSGLKFWVIENPATGYLKKFLGKPAFIFEPSDFGDPYTKKTALWGMFNEPKKSPVKATRGTMVKYAAQFKEIEVDERYASDLKKRTGVDKRTIRRSITPQGFAKAFFKANQ